MTFNLFCKKTFSCISFFLFISIHFSPIQAQENTIGVTNITWDATDGFTIYSSRYKTYIVNNCGQLIKEWESENLISNSAYLLDNGDLIRTGTLLNIGYSRGGLIEKFNWAGDLIWSYEINSDDYVQHHDVEPLPNGNILALCYNFKQPIDAWNAGAQDTLEYYSTSIFEIEPLENNEANIIWEWHLWNHLIQDIDSTRSNYGILENHPELFDINEMYFPNDSTFPGFYANVGPDWMHMNSIDYNENRDEILLSSRDHNEIFILDHSTNSNEAASHSGGKHNMGGDFIYRFGRDEFYGQHDAHWVNRNDYDENAIVVFNNGFRYDDLSRRYSSVDLFVPKINSLEKYIHYEVDTFEVLLKLDDPNKEYSEIMGSAQILDNNRILICNSERHRFMEFDNNRNLKWNYYSPLNSSGEPNTQGNPPISSSYIFRAKRLPLSHPAFENNWEIGDPIELNFNIDSCSGITTANTTSIDLEIKIFPNPSKRFFTLQSDQIISKIFIYNSLGKIYNPKLIENNKWDVEKIPDGLYFMVLYNTQGQTFTNKIVIHH